MPAHKQPTSSPAGLAGPKPAAGAAVPRPPQHFIAALFRRSRHGRAPSPGSQATQSLAHHGRLGPNDAQIPGAASLRSGDVRRRHQGGHEPSSSQPLVTRWTKRPSWAGGPSPGSRPAWAMRALPSQECCCGHGRLLIAVPVRRLGRHGGGPRRRAWRYSRPHVRCRKIGAKASPRDGSCRGPASTVEGKNRRESRPTRPSHSSATGTPCQCQVLSPTFN